MNKPVAKGLNAVRCTCLMRVACDLQHGMLTDPDFKNVEFNPVSVIDRVCVSLCDDALPSDNPEVRMYYALDIVVGEPTYVDDDDFPYTQVFVMVDDELVGRLVVDDSTTRIEDSSRVEMDGIISRLKMLLTARRQSVGVKPTDAPTFRVEDFTTFCAELKELNESGNFDPISFNTGFLNAFKQWSEKE